MNPTEISRRLRTRLKTRHMLLLVALDDARNMHGAATLANMTQPGASKMLKDIEEMLGRQLFDRLARGVRPTLFGEALIRHVRLALEHLAQGEEELAAIGAGLSGQVTLGSIIAPALTLIPRAIARAKDEAPNLCIGVEIGSSHDLIGQLKQERLDFLIGRILETEQEPGLLYEEISEETECIVARKGHPLCARTDLTLHDLAAAKWILSPQGTILRSHFDMMFRRADLGMPTNLVEVTSISIITSLLQQTDFLNIMPADVAGYYAKTGEIAILPIEVPCPMTNYGIIRYRDQLLSPGATLFLRHIRETVLAMRHETQMQKEGFPCPADSPQPGPDFSADTLFPGFRRP